jgi:CRISPR-associated protein Csm5
MGNTEKKRYYKITPLTGVHIGTGEELTLLDYKIAEKFEGKEPFKKPKYLKISHDGILQRLYDEKKEIPDFDPTKDEDTAKNIKKLFNFFHENCKYISDIDYLCFITDGFLKKYEENKEKDPKQNAANVYQMYHSYKEGGKSNPVIPGSSIKGSVRTALLNGYLKKLKKENNQIYQSLIDKFEIEKEIKDNEFIEFEKKMQNDILDYEDGKDDPLRGISFSDCPFSLNDQLVGVLRNTDPEKQDKNFAFNNIQIQAEVIRGAFFGGTKSESEICITINEKLPKMPFPEGRGERSEFIKPIDFDDIHKMCNSYYWNEFDNEYTKFYDLLNDERKKLISQLYTILQKASKKEGQFIIRVGRWSQIEFVTFEDSFRKPKIRLNKKNVIIPYGTTRTLFDYNGKYAPLGWCILTLKE